MTQDALLDALAEAFAVEDDGGAMTTREVMAALGCGEQAAKARIRKLLDDGLAECVRVPRAGMDGVVQPVRAYRLKAA